MNLFFTPGDAKAGDVIPFFNEESKVFDNYYLKHWNPGTPKEEDKLRWHRITTEDHRTLLRRPPISREAQAPSCGRAGCIICFTAPSTTSPRPSGSGML